MASAKKKKKTQKIFNDYSDIFTGIGHSKGTFFLAIKGDVKPYHVLTRCVAYALQEKIQKGTRKTKRKIDVGTTKVR